MVAVGNVNIISKNNTFINNSASNGGVLAAVGDISNSFSQFQLILLYGLGASAPHGNISIHISRSQFFRNRALGGVGGGVVYAGNGVSVNLTHSHFTNNSALGVSGGVLWLSDNTVDVTSSSFKNNSARVGGTVYLNSGFITVANSSFDQNSADEEGGALNLDQSSARIDETTFRGNTANKNGGTFYTKSTAVVIHECRFYNNRADKDGGVIASQEGNTSDHRSTYGNNTAGHDGGVVAYQQGSLTVQESIFIGNSAGNDGGVIQVYQGNIDISQGLCQNNSAINDGGVINAFESTSRISGFSFESNYATSDGGAISAYQGVLNVSEDSTFSYNVAHNDGGVIHAYELATTIDGNGYVGNRAGNRGGVLFVYQGSLRISRSIVSHSEATDGGVLYADQGNITMRNTSSLENTAREGGVLHTYQGTVSVSHSSFSQNSVDNDGGVWFIEGCRAVLQGINFATNSANNGGAVYSSNSTLSLFSSVFKQNSARNTGGALYSSQSAIKSFKTLVFTKNRASLGVVYLLGSAGHLSGRTLVSENIGSFVVFNSMVTFSGTTHFISGSEPIRSHDTEMNLREGGALTASKSDIVFNGTSSLTDNRAKNGGAIHATESNVYVNGETTIANNTANDTGGGVYLYMSELQCQSNSSLKISRNVATEKGGGIHAISSSINVIGNFTYNTITDDENMYRYVGSLLYFSDNEGEKGGGLCLEMNSKLYILKSTPHDEPFSIVTFSGNSADYGGAIYVSDDSNLGMCNPIFSSHYKAKECFFQILAIYSSTPSNFSRAKRNGNTQNIYFSQNHANTSGSSLFGGLIDRCKLEHFTELEKKVSLRTTGPPHNSNDNLIVNGIRYMSNISNINVSEISSEPVQLCFCKDGVPDCNYQPEPIRVIKGKRFSVEVVAVDQVGHLIYANIHSLLLRTGGGLGSGQDIQNTSETCTELKFNLFSPNDKEEMIMYAEGPCESSPQSQRRLSIQFTACDSCPIGFEKHIDEDTNCQCICDYRLEPYITKCNASTELLEREGNFWITYVNNSDNTSNGYLVYGHCPLNYCKPPTAKVEINLNIPDGADVQCAAGHSGMLCGSCLSNLSLSLGSSRCIPCSTSWTTIVGILVAAFFTGISLVAFLLVLNLTVAVGTLNGIILYANIVASSSSTYLPFSTPNFATVFISWLNLEIGFDTCFFKGMDAFWKTLFQLAFPMYVIFLVVIVIFVSERSTKFARLLAKRNPVATLATLILLSYTKFLNTIITSLSYAVLVYPSGSNRRLWLPDATVEYLKGKHIALFVIALLILLVGVVYTSLLFSWQWILRHQDKTLILKWLTKHQKLCHFIEPYHAPYTFEQRYWTGLLLFVRVILYIISAINLTGDPQVSLVATVILIGLLPLLKAILEKKIYNDWSVDVMEMIMYFNIISFAVVTLKTGTTGKQAIVAYTSVLFTFTLLLIVIIFHLFRHTGLFSAVKKIKMCIIRIVDCRKKNHSRCARPPVDEDDQPLITHSIVEIPTQLHHLELSHQRDSAFPELAALPDLDLPEGDADSLPFGSPHPVIDDVDITTNAAQLASGESNHQLAKMEI